MHENEIEEEEEEGDSGRAAAVLPVNDDCFSREAQDRSAVVDHEAMRDEDKEI